MASVIIYFSSSAYIEYSFVCLVFLFGTWERKKKWGDYKII